MTLDAYLKARSDRCSGCGFHTKQGCRCTDPEWTRFKAALRESARDGLIHQADMRRLIRGRIEPKHIGSLYRRAKAEGLIRDTGEREPSNDVAGRNTDKLDRIYALAT